MKLQRTTDRRLVAQLIVICLLTILPVVMIVMNGTQALRAILTPLDAQAGTASAHEPASAAQTQGHKAEPLMFGVYDPAGEFAADQHLKLRHVYVDWNALDAKKLTELLRSLEAHGFHPMLTIEPWPLATSQEPLLSGIINGEYDRIIDDIAMTLRELRGPVYLSWGHEMDQDLTERYPWSNADPAEFVAAYRYVVDRIRAQVNLPVRWVWAGVLKKGSLRYWPGENYADFVGMPVYSFPAWDQRTYGYIRDFRTTFEEKQQIVETLNKPLIITELGVSGSDDFESFWLRQAFVALDDCPNLAGVIFFYARDADGAWGRDVSTPDWRVHPEAIRSLVKWKLQ